MMSLTSFLILACLAVDPGWAHFLLKLPRGLGYDQKTAEVAPCGGYEFTGMVLGNNFTVQGYPFAAISTHPNVTYTVQVKLLPDDVPEDNGTAIMPPLFVSTAGSLCIPDIKVNTSWVGHLGEYLVTQEHASGKTYQCAMVQFIDGPATNASALTDCKNSTGVIGSFQPWGSTATTGPTPTSTSGPANSSGASDADSGGSASHSGLWVWTAMASLSTALLLHLL